MNEVAIHMTTITGNNFVLVVAYSGSELTFIFDNY